MLAQYKKKSTNQQTTMSDNQNCTTLLSIFKKISKICLSLISHEDNSVGESPSIVVGGVKSFSIDTFR